MTEPRLRALVPIILGAAFPSLVEPQAHNRVVEAVTRGMSCPQEPVLESAQLTCEYTVGTSLEFAIVAVGQDGAAINFLRVDADGDYYASVGLLHGCVIVKEGKTTLDRLAKEGGTLPQFAFVSPKNGKVYSDWPSCAKAR